MSMDLAAYVEHFRARVVQDALNEVLPSYWLRRAEQFAAVGTPACDEIASACRAKAEYLRRYPVVGIEADVVQAIRAAA
jgi:hypothetical protein